MLGAILIVIGLYSVLWGKYKEYQEKEGEESIPDPIKDAQANQIMVIEDLEANNNRISSIGAAVAISSPMPHPPMIAVEAPMASSTRNY